MPQSTAGVIVFEYLEMQGKIRKETKASFMEKVDIQKLCVNIRHIRTEFVSRVSASNTSRLTVTEGAVVRKQENHSLCTLPDRKTV